MNPTIRFLTLSALILACFALTLAAALNAGAFLSAGYLGYAIGASFPLLSFGAGFAAHYFAEDR